MHEFICVKAIPGGQCYKPFFNDRKSMALFYLNIWKLKLTCLSHNTLTNFTSRPNFTRRILNCWFVNWRIQWIYESPIFILSIFLSAAKGRETWLLLELLLLDFLYYLCIINSHHRATLKCYHFFISEVLHFYYFLLS